jgi:hypothetical protein
LIAGKNPLASMLSMSNQASKGTERKSQHTFLNGFTGEIKELVAHSRLCDYLLQMNLQKSQKAINIFFE